MRKYLTDTTVLVDHLRGDTKAFNFLRTQLPGVSHATFAELIQGTKNKHNLKLVAGTIEDLEVIPISEKISKLSIDLTKKFFLSHSLGFLDALIAATAIKEKLTLVTANTKHFTFIKELKIIDWKKIKI